MVINDETKKIKVDNKILERIISFRQMKSDIPEAGGILAGRENISNDNLIIEYHTEPMNCDYQTHSKFTRKDVGHVLFFQSLYKKSEGTIGYVGEWHTHPEDIPQYSIIDLKNWRNINKKVGNNQVQYHLIVGRKAVVIWKYSKKNLIPVKIAIIYV